MPNLEINQREIEQLRASHGMGVYEAYNVLIKRNIKSLLHAEEPLSDQTIKDILEVLLDKLF